MNDHDDDNRIIEFPDIAARNHRQKQKQEKTHTIPSEPMINLPPVVKYLCLVNIVIFLPTSVFEVVPDDWLYALAFVPERHTLLGFGAIFTSMFLHAGWVHLGMNIGMLMAFGAALEKHMGWKKFVLLYMASGVVGSLLHLVFYFNASQPVIGASGAISGLFGAVILFMQASGRGHGLKLMPIIVLWVGISLFFGLFGSPGVDNPIAWVVHIGGFFGGLALYKPILSLRLP